MIRIMSELPPHVIGFEGLGKLTVHDYETVIIPEINRAVAESRKLHVLCYLGPEFTGFSVGALFSDASLGLFHMSAYERVALVSDLGWIRASAGLFGLMMSGAVRAFSNAELDTARDWVKE
jgi:hypothetical protein